MAPTGFERCPSHICGVAFYPVWHLVTHILSQWSIYTGNMNVISISGIQETVMYHIQKIFRKREYRNIQVIVIHVTVNVENTPRRGVNKYMANLMTNDAELKTNCKTPSVTKECSRIFGDGLWTISSKFF